jgi:hypothetical protein
MLCGANSTAAAVVMPRRQNLAGVYDPVHVGEGQTFAGYTIVRRVASGNG